MFVSPLQAIPLVLTVNKSGTGGVVGLSPTVALRKGDTTDTYLDWADDTFKTTGWTLKNAPLTEVGGGHYQKQLDLSVLTLSYGQVLVAEYVVTDAGYESVAQDTYYVEDIPIIRKSIINRLEEFPGNPGQLILYDDDGVTPIKSWQLRDAAGGPTLAVTGAPSKRSAST